MAKLHRPQELCSWGMLDISHTHRQKVCEWIKSKVTKRDQQWKHISSSWWVKARYTFLKTQNKGRHIGFRDTYNAV